MASDDNGFCHDYFLLKPEEASYCDIFSLLFSSELKNRRFIQYAGHLDGNFRRRWFIFISLLAQKLLLLRRIPMALMGYLVEMWLNLLSCNGGLCMLLQNITTGFVCLCLYYSLFGKAYVNISASNYVLLISFLLFNLVNLSLNLQNIFN